MEALWYVKKNYRGTGMVEEREKLKVMGRESLMLGREQLDLRYLEQLADREQTQTLGCLLKYAKEQYSGKTTNFAELIEDLIRKLEKEGIGSVSGQKDVPAGMRCQEDRRSTRALTASDFGI